MSSKVEGQSVIIKNAVMLFAHLDPKNPVKGYQTEKRQWEVQIRTNKPEQRQAWAEANLSPKLMLNKPELDENGDPIPATPYLDESGKRQWRVNIRRKAKKFNGEDNTPVPLVDGGLNPIDPTTLGNGSVGNIKVWVRPYKTDSGEDKFSVSLLAIQVVKYKVYSAQSGPAFDMTETEVIEDEDEEFETQSTPATPAAATPAAATVPKAPSVPVKTADSHPAEAF